MVGEDSQAQQAKQQCLQCAGYRLEISTAHKAVRCQELWLCVLPNQRLKLTEGALVKRNAIAQESKLHHTHLVGAFRNAHVGYGRVGQRARCSLRVGCVVQLAFG
jgi:hypothetical protein